MMMNMKNKNKSNLILCDCPWGAGIYGERKNTNTKFGGGAKAHYPTMSKQEILDFKSEIDKASEDNCILLQWVTGPALEFGIEVMNYWGFQYKTIAQTWIKISKSGNARALPGSYFASNCELLLLGTKGNTKLLRPEVKLVNQVIMSELREHSRKPSEIYERIELAYPHLDKIEFFSRQKRDGWMNFGLEVDKF
jgi:N6-adenosine-specific RNA methylase IME4